MFSLLHADCRDVMANMGDDTVDAVVTDPPYHLASIVKRFGPGSAPQQFGSDGAYARAARGFMGQTWDGGDIAFDVALWAEVLRVLKPGGFVLAFGGTRTYHRMAVAIEDAGFEIRDMLEWIYGSGFPKGSVVDGRGPALKPAHEPICMGRKPFRSSIAANVALHGTGALNINACRVGTGADQDNARANKGGGGIWNGTADGGAGRNLTGRFPANILHDGSWEVVDGFPSEAGANAPASGPSLRTESVSVAMRPFAGLPDDVEPQFHGDQGSAARFFYCAKASKRDRDEGCEHLPPQPAGMVSENSGQHLTRRDDFEVAHRANFHPTVKPTPLMQWLVRLATPVGGVVFDPFTGSGSTGKAAMLERRRFIGAEMTAEYIPIARARIEWARARAA